MAKLSEETSLAMALAAVNVLYPQIRTAQQVREHWRDCDQKDLYRKRARSVLRLLQLSKETCMGNNVNWSLCSIPQLGRIRSG